MNNAVLLQKLAHTVHLRAKPQNQTLLAKAVVELRNKSGQYVPCRVLLDSASQCHFITEKCVQRLRLSKIRLALPYGASIIQVLLQHTVYLFT